MSLSFCLFIFAQGLTPERCLQIGCQVTTEEPSNTWNMGQESWPLEPAPPTTHPPGPGDLSAISYLPSVQLYSVFSTRWTPCSDAMVRSDCQPVLGIRGGGGTMEISSTLAITGPRVHSLRWPLHVTFTQTLECCLRIISWWRACMWGIRKYQISLSLKLLILINLILKNYNPKRALEE